MGIFDGEVLRWEIADQRQVDCEVGLWKHVPVLIGKGKVHAPQCTAFQVHRRLTGAEGVSSQREQLLTKIDLLLVLCSCRGLLIDVVEECVVVEDFGRTPGC